MKYTYMYMYIYMYMYTYMYMYIYTYSRFNCSKVTRSTRSLDTSLLQVQLELAPPTLNCRLDNLVAFLHHTEQ